ncbi:MAG TPA: hypothetical protein DHU96_26405, partial [Actinobacteria bacterium]|nr:hypothetical protein [Actinomycetota bacterium]
MGTATAVSLVLPLGVSAAATSRPMPSLQSLLARARILSDQINTLDEEYNGLRIQLTQARTEAKVAQRTYAEDLVRLGAG